jgi:oligopeptidase B
MIACTVTPGCSSAKTGEEAGMTKAMKQMPAAPKAKRIKKELTLHGHTRSDYYFWLNQRENPEVVNYLKAENNYLKAVMKHTEALRKKLYHEFISRIKQEDSSVPYLENGYYYYKQYEKGKEYPVYCRKKAGPENTEEVLLDVNEMAKGSDYYHVAEQFGVSPDGTLLAYGVDTVSRRRYTVYVKNLVTGEVLPERILNTGGAIFWANDNKTFYYEAKDDTLRRYKVFSHRLGTPVSQDREMFHEADETFVLYLHKSTSGKYITIESRSTVTTEYLYLDADRPGGNFKAVAPRQRYHEYSADHHGKRWIILSNYNAKNFKLVEAPIGKDTPKDWKKIIPHRQDVLLEAFKVFKDYLVVLERQKGLNRLRVIGWDGKKDVYIEFDDPTYSVTISQYQEFNSPRLRYIYNSLTTPESTYDFDMAKSEKTLLKREDVGKDFDPANYASEWLWATARDGVKVPISLVYRKGLKKNGDNPLFLYAYGSYGYSQEVNFSIDVLSLLDRGFVYAIAHIRGGQEMGRHWYEDGKLLKKKNTFTDYIDCAEFLVAEKFTNPGKLFANGGSAGGLLMGAVTNMRPDLFKAVIADVPFLDVVTTMLDKSIPLTTSEYDEWGNPESKEYYDYMLSYSPYDRVEAKNYPALLVTTGLHDSQVQYWEPAKWVAKLRVTKTGDNPLLLHTNMAGGHSGSSGRFRRYKETALAYAFILDQLGLKE